MAFASIVEIANRNMRRGMPTTESKLIISKHNNKAGPRLAFYIGRFIAEKAGLIKGDSVDILWDKDTGEGIIRRDNKNGKTVSFNKQGRGVVLIAWHEGMPPLPTTVILEAHGIEYKHHEILFDFPQGNGDPHGV